MRRFFSLSFLLVWALGLSACSSWKSDASYKTAVFSDDGVGMAAVWLHFKGKDTITHTKMKDHQIQILMKENLDSSQPPVLTPKLAGDVIELFFMRSQGYLILGRHTNWLGSYAGGDTGEIYYEKIGLDGSITPIAGGTFTVALSCFDDGGSVALGPAVRAIPSPDGLLLALYEAETTCTARSQTLTFLHAADLSLHSGPYDIPEAAPSGFGGAMGGAMNFPPVEMAWTDEGSFALSYWGANISPNSYSATVFEPGQEAEQNVELGMDCFHPVTRSSEVNAAGELVTIHEDNGVVGVGAPLSNDATALAFGCNL